MSNETLIGLLSTIFTAVIGALSWFTKRLIRDIEKRVESSQYKLARTQDSVDAKIKERFFDITKITDKMAMEIGEINKAVRTIEKNVDMLSFMVKTVDEKSRDRLDSLNRNTDQINQIIQKLLVMEQKISTYGTVKVKD